MIVALQPNPPTPANRRRDGAPSWRFFGKFRSTGGSLPHSSRLSHIGTPGTKNIRKGDTNGGASVYRGRDQETHKNPGQNSRRSTSTN